MSSFAYLESYGLSDIGIGRKKNEDRWIALSDSRFFAIADGMGGHNAGEIAAHTVIEHLSNWVKNLMRIPSYQNMGKNRFIHLLKRSIKDANRYIFDLGGKNIEMHGMGTTLACLSFLGPHIIYSHIGDSRIYCYRQGKLHSLTKDDSLSKNLFQSKEFLSEQKASLFPKNVITKAIGREPSLDPLIQIGEWKKNDLFLLCTDGLSDFIDEATMSLIMKQKFSLKRRSENLIQIAKENGSNDNITVLMITLLD